jgi:hypothetical protein
LKINQKIPILLRALKISSFEVKATKVKLCIFLVDKSDDKKIVGC